MEPKRRGTLIYGLLLGVWVLVVAWQIEEHSRVQEAAKRNLRSRSTEIGNTLSAVMRALRFRGSTVLQDRLEPVMNELVNGRTNELVNSSGLISIALLNTDGELIAAAGNTNLISNLSEGEYWAHDTVTFVNPIEGASVNPEGATNPIVVLAGPPPDFTNGLRGFQRRESRPDETNSGNIANLTTYNTPDTNAVTENTNGNTPSNSANRPRVGGRPRPPTRGRFAE
jgi:hypothetical protein